MGLLEKVDLLNFIFDEDGDGSSKEKEKPSDVTKTVVRNSGPTSAYLGPRNIFSNPISLDDLMEDDSASDNGLDSDVTRTVVRSRNEPTSAYLGPRNIFSNPITLEDLMEDDSDMGGEMVNLNDVLGSVSPPRCTEIEVITRPSIIVPVKKETVKLEPNLLKGGNGFLYVESKKARMEREKEERKRKFEAELDLAPEDIALATVPGLDFDPKTRTFQMEELRPQPIIKKRKKKAVPEAMKDERYWEKREKNKEATRRSREAKRLKENQIVLRAAYLEKENKVLKQELDTSNFEKSKLETEVDILKRKLQRYESSF